MKLEKLIFNVRKRGELARYDPLNAAREQIKSYDAMRLPAPCEWYGIGRVVRELAGLPRDFPFDCNIHHGIEFAVGVVPFYLQGNRPMLVCREEYVKLYVDKGVKAISVGLLQIQYRRLRGISQIPNPCGTLAFPSHSTHHITSVINDAEYANELANLPSVFQPVSVCLYWRDILLERHKAYLDKGLDVFTAGHVADPNFLSSLYCKLAGYKFTTGNSLGTHVIMSIEMGIPYFVTGDHPQYRIETGGDPEWAQFQKGQVVEDHLRKVPLAEQLQALLPDQATPEISSELKDFVTYLHGCDEAPEREQLNAFLRENCRRSGG
ncbi:MAG: hypothetical protein ACLP7P_16785 [Rhodomicrobium sp.]